MKCKVKILIATFFLVVSIVLLNNFSVDIKDVYGDWYNDSGICLRLQEDNVWICDGVFEEGCGIWKIKGNTIILSVIMDNDDYRAVFKKDKSGDYIVLLGEIYRKSEISK